MIRTGDDVLLSYPCLPRRIAHKAKNNSDEHKNSAKRSEKDNIEKVLSDKDSSAMSEVDFWHKNKDMEAQWRVNCVRSRDPIVMNSGKMGDSRNAMLRKMTPTDFMAMDVKKPGRNSLIIDSKTGGRSNTYSRFRKWSENRQNNLGSDRKGWNRWSYHSTGSEEREEVLRDMGGNIPQ